MSVALEFERSVEHILKTLGSLLTLRTPQHTERQVLSAFSTLGQNDGAIVGALGIEGKIIYCEPLDPPPQKFDRFLGPLGRSYVIHDVHEIFVQGLVVGHKCVVKAS